jgi:hypothetical protein
LLLEKEKTDPTASFSSSSMRFAGLEYCKKVGKKGVKQENGTYQAKDMSRQGASG